MIKEDAKRERKEMIDCLAHLVCDRIAYQKGTDRSKMENSKGGQGLAFKNLFKGLVRQLVGLRPFLLSLMTGVSFPQHKRKEEKTKNECCAYVHTHI